jgi:hypothetical protein
MQGKLDETKALCARAWGLKSGRHDITSCRILFIRVAIALLEAQPVTPYAGQLKMLLSGAPLEATGPVATAWDMASFLESLRPELPASDAAFLESLLAGLNDRTKVADLDHFPAWRDLAPVPLDALWPSS